MLYPDDDHASTRPGLLEKLRAWGRGLLLGPSEAVGGEDRPGRGEGLVGGVRKGGVLTAGRGAATFGVNDRDNPETIRFRKYATGAHLALRAAGVRTGQTPRETVWERGKARLYRYEPDTEKRFPIPVLLVYALILRPYILDLVPGNSLVEYLAQEGFDVYLLDWGFPGSEDKDLSFEDYVLDYMPEAVGRVLEVSGAEELTVLGHCQGGTVYASLFPEGAMRNLILLATPTDFAPERAGLFGLWTVLDPDLLIGPSGNVPADLAGRLLEGAAGAPALGYAPHAGPWDHVLLDRQAATFLAASKWVDDGVPFPGAAFRDWIRDFYGQNRLARGELALRARRVDLSNIRCPVLNIAGSKDLVCPLPQARATMDLVGSRDKEFLVLDAGHVGLMAGPVAVNEMRPRLRGWLEPRSGSGGGTDEGKET